MKTDYTAQCRFFTAEDACRIALQAYYAATKHITPPPGERWFDESGAPYASATDFAEGFVGELQARVGLLALDCLGGFIATSWSWDLFKIAAEIQPEKMAPVIAERDDENARIDAEFSGIEMNQLPPEDNHVHNAEKRGGDYA